MSKVIGSIAGLITIFGFITGLRSLPLVFEEQQSSLFKSAVPLSLSIPVFGLTAIAVLIIYFFTLMLLFKLLKSADLVSRAWDIFSFDEPGDWFFVAIFVLIGCCIILLLLDSAWGLSDILPAGDVALFIVSIPGILLIGGLYFLVITARYYGTKN